VAAMVEDEEQDDKDETEGEVGGESSAAALVHAVRMFCVCALSCRHRERRAGARSTAGPEETASSTSERKG
jgi:hypothetical protein